ncbi:RDD family protein [Caldibacillus thermoamylovorans]|uniref:RDD family protein n=1 Tax=Caldibacillus thermoamylovorans TaxID=35841 RepID=UPI001D08CAE1|nr:RDD family protein [Caldibacillus thermoamylovorans]MCB5936888.1 RDD family protein [Bacillus sp. DFI.2.34]MCB7078636.1 RDD family protein [Caldibacillus thermoamylovorans]
MNNIPIKNRLIELLVDYLIIIVYLVLLLIVNFGIILFIFKGVPKYTEIQAQLIATFTSVIPIILIFSYLDYFKNGSIGKRVSGLKLTYTNQRFSSSLLRNIIKFLPWQLGHVGVIHGIYNDFDITAIMIANSGTFLGLVLLFMGLFRKDKRHLGDLIAGTKIVLQ